MMTKQRALMLPIRLDKEGVVASILAFGLFVNTFNAGFAYDDTRAILQNDDVIASTADLFDVFSNDFWGTPLSHSGSHKSYRPLTTLTFRLNMLASRTSIPDPFHFHVTNVILHAFSTYLFVLLVKTLTLSSYRTDKLVPLISGLLFASHPIHCEAVSGLVGRADVLAGIFFSLAILAYRKHLTKLVECDNMNARAERNVCDKNGNNVHVMKTTRKEALHKSGKFYDHKYFAMTFALSTCAMLSKEIGVTALALCFVADLLDVFKLRKSCPQDKAKRLSALTMVASILLAIRAKVMGFKTPFFAKADNPAAASDSLLTRFLTFSYLPVFNFGLLLCPSQLSFDWSMSAIPMIMSLLDTRNILSLVFYGSLGSLTIKYFLPRLVSKVSWQQVDESVQLTQGVVAFAMALAILPFLPSSNLFFYVGFVVAERVLYIPSMGFCLLVAIGASRLIDRFKNHRVATVIFLAAMLTPLAFKTVARNRDWTDEESLYKSGLSVNPPKAYGNLANILTARGRLKDAEIALKKALEFRPNMADSHYNLGVLYQKQSRIPEAIEAYQYAIKFRPKLALAHLNLGLSLSTLGKQEMALEVLKNITTLDDDGLKDPKSHKTTQISALMNAGRISLELGRAREAVYYLHEAHERASILSGSYPNAQSLFNLLGEAHERLNETSEAEKFYRAALSQKPNHLPAYLRYGKMLAKNKTRQVEAESWFVKAKSIAPDDPSVALHFGLFLMDQDRTSEAAREFEASAIVDHPEAYESAFNAGVAFRLAGNLERAEHYYRKAVSLRPKDSSAHMNLGAMLHLVGKLSEAEQSYFKALDLNPGNPTTRTNIQRLQNIMRKKGMSVRTLK